jgi:hypothetical protein
MHLLIANAFLALLFAGILMISSYRFVAPRRSVRYLAHHRLR